MYYLIIDIYKGESFLKKDIRNKIIQYSYTKIMYSFIFHNDSTQKFEFNLNKLF